MEETPEELSEDIEFKLEEINERFQTEGFFSRFVAMIKGFSKPRNSREYKIARIELQRLAAPLIACVTVIMFVIILIVMTEVTGQAKKTIEIRIGEVDDSAEETLEEIAEEPPDDIEPPPLEDVEIMVDVATPGPMTTVAPAAAAPAQQQAVSVKPAAQDSVAFVDSPVKMKAMTGSRNPGSIGAATRGGAGYGDAQTEAAVMKILWWLKGVQKPNGSWATGMNPLANTALAVLTYLAHGEYPGAPSPYQKDFGPTVQKAIEFLVGSVRPGPVVRMAGVDGNEYAFLIATYALCEAYGMTKNPNCKEAAMMCLDRIVKGQSPTGGWDYKINPKSTRDDMSFAGWALQALKAGKMAGLHPDGLDECIKKAIRCLKTRNFKNGGFNYTAGGGPTGLTATGCLAMQLLGFSSQPEVRKALDFMKTWQPTFNAKELSQEQNNLGGNAQYYCYYATQCKYQAGMRDGAAKADEVAWQKWNVAMKKLYTSTLTTLPETIKDWTGKAHKQGYYNCSQDSYKGDVMSTCLVALQLMVYYRYLPTSQTKATAEVHDDDSKSSNAVDRSDDVGVEVDI